MTTDIIRLLPDSIANQIAAGEVIQCPASAVKELVENSIDAGGTNIKIILRDAGRTLIQVVDNGKGMSPSDARLSFERHSTSKISSADDLFSLHTMGFRGEALASIAAVSQVELITMRPDDPVGTRLLINGSRFESQEAIATVPGTNMMVKNLFFNVPARRKYLKKDTVELSNVVHEFERLALVNPTVQLTLIHNDNTLHQLLPASLKQRIGDLFGRSVQQQMLPVETSTSIVKITGFVGRPDGARRRNALQYFFVNGRNMKHPYFRKAVLSCYEKLISADVQPNYFINFEVDPATIDVNIHPTKNEIKFEHEQPIWQILQATVRESLGRFNQTEAIDFSTDSMVDIPSFNPGAELNIGPLEEYNPFAPENDPEHQVELQSQPWAEPQVSPSRTVRRASSLNTSVRHDNAMRRNTDDWEKLYDRWQSGTESVTVGSQLNLIDEPETTADESRAFQLNDKYIIAPSRGGILVVDQYRAQVNILYNEFLQSAGGVQRSTQNLIFPEMYTADAHGDAMLTSLIDDLTLAGFDLSPLGDKTWSINGIPAGMDGANPMELLKNILDTVDSQDINPDVDLNARIALAMARTRAVRGGQRLSQQEIDKTLHDLLALPTPTYTPDGHLVLHVISQDAIERPF